MVTAVQALQSLVFATARRVTTAVPVPAEHEFVPFKQIWEGELPMSSASPPEGPPEWPCAEGPLWWWQAGRPTMVPGARGGARADQ